MMRRVAVLLLICTLAGAETRGPKWKRAWAWSAAAFAASAVADAASSRGRYELNPVLRGPDGHFGAKGMAIKFSMTGAILAGQWLLLRKHPGQAQTATWANFGAAGLTGAAAGRNLAIR